MSLWVTCRVCGKTEQTTDNACLNYPSYRLCKEHKTYDNIKRLYDEDEKEGDLKRYNEIKGKYNL
jgi:hypothetical protein